MQDRECKKATGFWWMLIAVGVCLLMGITTATAGEGTRVNDDTFTAIEEATLHYFGVGDTLSLNGNHSTSGHLLIVGGSLQTDNTAVYQRFIDLAGGAANAKIAIMPTASSVPIQSASAMRDNLVNHGVAPERIYTVPVAVKDDSSTPGVDESTWSQNGFSTSVAQSLDGYTGVWFVGGVQNRITTALLGTDGSDGAVMAKIRTIHADGGVIGGTSAGAAAMSRTMISGGTSLAALTREIVYEDMGASDPRLYIERGLDLFPFGIVDQHFLARGRFGRLLSACVNMNVPMGFGIDENTAISVSGNTLEVIGVEASRSGLVVVDIRGDGLNAFTPDTRRLSTTGWEYFDGNTMHTAIFAPNALVDVICEGLVDNTASTAKGVAFEMNGERRGVGVRVIFAKQTGTEGFYGKIDGVYTYTATHIAVEVEPIGVRISPLMRDN